MDNLKAKKRHPEEIAVYTAIYVCAAFSVLLLLGIIIYVLSLIHISEPTRPY